MFDSSDPAVKAMMARSSDRGKGGGGSKASPPPSKPALDLTPGKEEEAINLWIKAHRTEPEYRTKTEARFRRMIIKAWETDGHEDHGRCAWWTYEPFKIILGPNTTYKVDFLVVFEDRHCIACEVKGGYIRDVGRTKYKIASRIFPVFELQMWQQNSKKSPWKRVY